MRFCWSYYWDRIFFKLCRCLCVSKLFI